MARASRIPRCLVGHCVCTCPLTRRGLLAGSTGVVTTAAVARFEPAAAGQSRTETFAGTFTGVGTPDWHYLPVEVPRGVREIEVSYAYEKTDTGLGFSANVIDIGIFDPSGHDLGDASGFRGWSGGARDRFRISRRRATPGYLAGPITPGTWHVVLGPFAVVPPGVDYEVTVTLHFGRQPKRFRPKPAPRRVKGSGPGWYRGDCHLHTVHSDGRHTQRSLLALAREAGLDFIGSTEHNTSSAQLTWGRHVPDDFLVIPGEEVTTRAGHWLALGLPAGTWIDWRFRPEDDELATFTERVRGVGALAVTAHPFSPGPGSTWGFDPTYADMDLVEIWNGPWTLDDQTAVAAWHAMLVAGRYVPVMGNSDLTTRARPSGCRRPSSARRRCRPTRWCAGSAAGTRGSPSPARSTWRSRRAWATGPPAAGRPSAPVPPTSSTYASPSAAHRGASPRSSGRWPRWRARSPTRTAPPR